METIKNIVTGNILLTIDTIFLLPKSKHEYSDVRLEICRRCDESTWLLISEYLVWLKSHGIEVLKNLDDLSVLPKLEKKEYHGKKKLFCRICKCWLPAKTYVKNEKCPLNKWSNENG